MGLWLGIFKILWHPIEEAKISNSSLYNSTIHDSNLFLSKNFSGGAEYFVISIIAILMAVVRVHCCNYCRINLKAAAICQERKEWKDSIITVMQKMQVVMIEQAIIMDKMDTKIGTKDVGDNTKGGFGL